MKRFKLMGLLPYAVACLLVAAAILLVPHFGKLTNLLNIIKQSSYIAIPAVGLTMVLIIGDIDLSVGNVISLSGVVNGSLLINGVPLPVAMLMTLLISALFGLLKGVVISKILVPSFICTFVVGQIASGFALLLTNGGTINEFNSPAYKFMGTGKILSIPVPDLFVLLFALVGWIILAKLPIGNRIYAIGNNELVVKQEGLDTDRIRIFVHILTTICAGFSGILLSARLSAASPVQGNTYQLDCIAACVIGGVSMNGGKGKAINSVLGAIFLSAIRNCLNLLKLASYLQNLIIGVLIVGLVVFSVNVLEKSADKVSVAVKG